MKTKKPYPPLTPLHMEVLTLMAAGRVPGDIGLVLWTSRETTQRLIREACQRAGIKKHPRRQYWEEREAAKVFLDYRRVVEETKGLAAMADPMF